MAGSRKYLLVAPLHVDSFHHDRRTLEPLSGQLFFA